MDTIFKSANNYLILNNNQIIDRQLDTGIEVSIENKQLQIEIVKASKAVLQINLNELKDINEVTYVIHPNNQLKIVELHHFCDSITFKRNVDIQEGSNVTFLSFNEGNPKAIIQTDDYFKVGKDVTLSSSYGELSDCSIKGNYFYDLYAEGSSTNIKMAVLSRETTKKEFYVSLHHRAKNTFGEMENYGVCKDQSFLKFEGLGKIDFGMALASSHQTSKIMVFDEKCSAEVNPLLLIDNYDVQASHAAGVGRMDLDQLYYLQSRGLTPAEAKHLITMGYLLPIVKEMNDEEVTDYFVDILNQKVGK